MRIDFCGSLLALCLGLGLGGCAADTSDAPNDVDSRQDAWWWNSDYTETRYPIVLMHGFMGFDSIAGVIDYWPGIPSTLKRDGADVYVTTSSTANSSEVRGEIIIEQLEDIQAATGAQKFNLIGHSQGGLDGRYIAAVRPDLVASLTTVGTPHKGSGLADLAGGGGLGEIGTTGVELLARLIRTLGGAGGPIDAEAALQTLSADGLVTFNADYPTALPSGCGKGQAVVNGIRYYSWTGTGVLTNVFDILDPLWGITSLFFNERNDGLVGRCSAHFGDVIRDNYYQNHLDEVNLLFGLVSPFTTKPKSVFRSHANRLKNAGL